MGNREYFKKEVEKSLNELKSVLDSKGKAYSGDEDYFANFKRIASDLNINPETVWYVYFSKHLDALKTYLSGNYCDSEPISGRIIDLINYLILLKVYTEEKLENK